LETRENRELGRGKVIRRRNPALLGTLTCKSLLYLTDCNVNRLDELADEYFHKIEVNTTSEEEESQGLVSRVC